MWILACDGDVLNHKRVWLRPGKTYLFGRTRPEKGRYTTGFRINHKTVSRKHLTLTVEAVEANDVGLISKQSTITLEDAGTKMGTTVGDKRVNGGAKHALSGTAHTIRLAGYEYSFSITWKPVILTYTISSKVTKAGGDPLALIRARLAELDVKAISTYAKDKTTHLIASKRNTARGLQALVQGARIVADTFVDALVAAATPTNLDEPESFAVLEEDFDAGWPNEVDHLPEPGREPGPKEPEFYEPDPDRRHTFNGMTFVFCDARQFENLQPPITDGGGNALLYDLEPEVTTARDLHRYVKDVAGEKDGGELKGDNKVIVVKFGGAKGHEDWSTRIQHNLALALGFRLIEQNEFLDAILNKSPAKLWRRLEMEHVADPNLAMATPGPETQAQNQTNSAGLEQNNGDRVETTQVEDVKPARRPQRGKITSVFKGFDDGFDPSEIQPESTRSSRRNGTQSEAAINSLNTDMAVDNDEDEDDNGSSYLPIHTRVTNSRKHPAPDSDDEVRKIEDSMFPGAAVMKRRKLEHMALKGEDETSEPTTRTASETPAEPQREPKKPKKELDISAAVRARREAEEKAKRGEVDGPEDGDAFDEMTLSQMQSLVVIEELDVRPRAPGPKRTDAYSHDGTNGRWKEEWNGRKNFKKFRRQGEGGAERKRGQTVIVPLQEVKYGNESVSDSYWGSSNSRPGGFRDREREREALNEAGVEEEFSRNSTKRRKANWKAHDAEEDRGAEVLASDNNMEAVPTELQNGNGPEMIIVDVDAPRLTRAGGIATQMASTQGSTRGTKRAVAIQPSEMRSVPKRQKRLDEAPRESNGAATGSGSDEELKFRFRKRGDREKHVGSYRAEASPA